MHQAEIEAALKGWTEKGREGRTGVKCEDLKRVTSKRVGEVV